MVSKFIGYNIVRPTGRRHHAAAKRGITMLPARHARHAVRVILCGAISMTVIDAAEQANYDESAVRAYTLPDVKQAPNNRQPTQITPLTSFSYRS